MKELIWLTTVFFYNDLFNLELLDNVEEEADMSCTKTNINADTSITVLKCTNQEGMNVWYKYIFYINFIKYIELHIKLIYNCNNIFVNVCYMFISN